MILSPQLNLDYISQTTQKYTSADAWWIAGAHAVLHKLHLSVLGAYKDMLHTASRYPVQGDGDLGPTVYLIINRAITHIFGQCKVFSSPNMNVFGPYARWQPYNMLFCKIDDLDDSLDWWLFKCCNFGLPCNKDQSAWVCDMPYLSLIREGSNQHSICVFMKCTIPYAYYTILHEYRWH